MLIQLSQIGAEDKIDRVLIQLNTQKESQKQYLAGYIDSLFDNNLISEEIRAFLYLQYVG